jgi:hypothetical protein
MTRGTIEFGDHRLGRSSSLPCRSVEGSWIGSDLCFLFDICLLMLHLRPRFLDVTQE